MDPLAPVWPASSDYVKVQALRKQQAQERINNLLSVKKEELRAPYINHLESVFTIALDHDLGVTLTSEQLVCICYELRDAIRWRKRGKDLAEALQPFVKG